jgi:signal transduction histidine kinase
MPLLTRYLPEFWTALPKDGSGPRMLFNYRRMWKQCVLVTASVCVIPLVIMAVLNYIQYHNALKAELTMPMGQLIQGAQKSIAFFLEERRAALEYAVEAHGFKDLSGKQHLAKILVDLKRAFGGFIDLGIIDSSGVQQVYIGPYALEGKGYRDQAWFREVLFRGVYVSEVFLGYRNLPHFVIAVRHEKPDGGYFILRATIDTQMFNDLTARARIRESMDVFIVNQEGVLQTPSARHGGVMDKLPFPLPKTGGGEETAIVEHGDPRTREHFLVGAAPVESSPFTVVLVTSTPGILAGWFSLRVKFIGFFLISGLVGVFVVLFVCTLLVSRVYEADRKREAILHKVEYTNKLASLGRLAAGVAHEINNPLAIINENAGLLKDLVSLTPDFPKKEKTLKITNTILASVERCGNITHRLLGFARHIDVKDETIHLDNLVREVLSFLDKECHYRGISVTLKADDDLPPIQSDRGQLQQVFLNIINNAFAAVCDGGQITIELAKTPQDKIAVKIADNGCGIPAEHMKLIFEPFFTTKGRSGTGLGLSITYGIIQKLGGTIDVASREGAGATFTVTLPLKRKP